MIRIGTRGSKLALTQTGWVRTLIKDRFPELEVTINIIKTSADKNATASIRASSNTGVFVKELEEALLAGEVDLAVHSMKDLPTRIPDDLQIAAVPLREDPHDALISSTSARSISDLPESAVVATGSIRRQAQLLALRPDLRVVDIRGNVDTRLQKLVQGNVDALILAFAGLHRLGLQDRISNVLDFREMLPAPGQGALALECRKDDSHTAEVAGTLNDLPTSVAVTAERSFLRRVEGGCNAPVGVHCSLEGSFLEIDGVLAAPDGSRVIRRSLRKACEAAEEAGIELADSILAAGGKAILNTIRTA